MICVDKVYLWQQPDWPNWQYDLGRSALPLAEASRGQGALLGRMVDAGLG